jgi:hypothetical protein
MNQQSTRKGTFGIPCAIGTGIRSILPKETRLSFKKFCSLISGNKLTTAELRTNHQLCSVIITGVEIYYDKIVIRLSWKRILKDDTFQPIGIQCPFENKVTIARHSFGFFILQDLFVVVIRHNYDAKLNITISL